MNTKVKVGIAAAIVAALVALIVLDQKTTPKDETAKPGAKGEKKEEQQVAKEPTPGPERIVEPVPPTKKADVLVVQGDKKIYTVQPGDTLSGISAKVYNTSRHYQKIYDANKDQIDDPNTL